MANIAENSNYDPDIYLIGTADEVLGDVDGTANKQAKGLANRTKWLKGQLDALLNSLPLLSDFNTRLLASNGYQKFPGGLVVQWMNGGFRNNEDEYSLDFPTPFATACFGVSVSTHNTEINTVNYKDNDQWFQTRGWSNADVTIQLQAAGSGNLAANTMKPFIIAIGH